MKNLIVAAFTTLLVTGCAASPSYAKGSTCNEIYDVAESVMKSRQSGVPYPKLVDAASGSALITAMVHQAFDIRQAASDGYRKAITEDFANIWYRLCIRKGGSL